MKPRKRLVARRTRLLVLLAATLLGASSPAAAALLGEDLVYSAIDPCRLFDTRRAAAGPLTPLVARPFQVVGPTADLSAQGGAATGCGIPAFGANGAEVQAIMLNLTVVNAGAAGYAVAWPGDRPRPVASSLNFAAGQTVANGLIVPIRQDPQASADLNVLAIASTHAIGDVLGYFTRAARSGQVYLGAADGDSALNFHDGGAPGGRSLRWRDAASTFEVNGPLKVVGAVSQGSSVALKTDFTPVAGDVLLRGLAELPITTWRYRDEESTRHMGPTAEEFHRRFGLGRGDGTIAAVDSDGVALAAIQALLRRVEELERRSQEAPVQAGDDEPVHHRPAAAGRGER